MGKHDFDVIVSGYGPTGQAAASLLARLGHKVCAFEKHPTLYGLPRLCTIDGESARIVQAAGDIDYALRDSNPNRRYMLVNKDDKVLIDFDWSEDHICGFPLRISMHQPDIEEAMDQTARERGVDVRTGMEVVAIDQDDDGVTVTARERLRKTEDGWKLGKEQKVTAKYLIGADGARSAVRELSGFEMEDRGFSSAWLSVDATRKRKLPTVQGSEDLRLSIVTMAPEGHARAFIPVGYNRLRFEFWVDPESEHQEKLNPEVGYEAIGRYYGLTRDDVEIYRTVIYPFVSRLATKWRDRRVFIAGDAAHLMTPFLGQGACSGLRDAITLSWKLDLVLRDVSGDSLLDTYEEERKPHVLQHVIGSSELGKAALELDPEIAAARDEVMLRGEGPPPPPDPTLTTGILHRDENGEVQLPVGDVGPQGVVNYQGTSGRFDDVIGWGFQLILRDRDPNELLRDSQRELLDQIHCHAVGIGPAEADGVVEDAEGSYARFFDQHEIEGVLLRPDFFVFGVLNSADDLSALVDDLASQLGAEQASLA